MLLRMFSKRTALASAIAGAMFLACGVLWSSSGVAQVNAWYSCTIWDENLKVVVPPEVIQEATAEEKQYCSMLDIDYDSSIARACYLQSEFPNQTWVIYAPSEPDGVTALPC